MMSLNFQMVLILIIKKHEKWTIINPIHVYINRINNRLVFKIKDGYKLELQMSGTMKLLDLIAQKINRQNKKWRKRKKSWSRWSSLSPL